MSIGFVTYTLLPWLTRWQQSIGRDLIIAPDRYFAEFVVEGLLKGDIESRYNAYSIGRSWGWLSANDVRRFESMNNIGLQGDIYLQPMNMGEAGAVGGDPRPRERDAGRQGASAPVAVLPAANGQAAHPAPAAANGYLLQLALSSAQRLIRKEVAAVTKETERAAAPGNGRWSSKAIAEIPAWQEAVRTFYEKHTALVAETMRIDEDAARAYVAEQQRMLLAAGPEAMEGWEGWRALELAEACVKAAQPNVEEIP
jgi:hypothetical protein